MELGAEDSWTAAAARLRDGPELGPFRLAFLEALLRIADWRASGA
jgi:CRISPR-associated endonuclease/helicase Cas3